VWPEGKDAILRFKRSNGDGAGIDGIDDYDDDDGEGSDDSLYEILTGRTNKWKESGAMSGSGSGRKDMEDGGVEDELGSSVGTVRGLDDTFRGKRAVGGGSVYVGEQEQEVVMDREEEQEEYGDGAGVLGDSGMSEMF